MCSSVSPANTKLLRGHSILCTSYITLCMSVSNVTVPNACGFVPNGQQPYQVAATPSIRPSCYTRSVAVSISFHAVGTALLFYMVISLSVAATPSIRSSCSTQSVAVSISFHAVGAALLFYMAISLSLAATPSIRPSCYTRSVAVSFSFHTVSTTLLFYTVSSRIR